MLNSVLFTTEIKEAISSRDFTFLRIQYTPIIGSKAVNLYCLLYDYHIIRGNNRSYYDFAELAKVMNCKQKNMLLARKKLEAVGLLRVFEKADNKHFIFAIKQPLSPQEFKKNSLLFKETISKIGDLIFERLWFGFKDKELAKDEFRDITTKYQDLFSFHRDSKTLLETTQSIPLIASKSIEDAVLGLNPEQFVGYLSNAKLSPAQISMIPKLMNYGFSAKSINLIIKYSFERNNQALIVNHILTIAQDLNKKEVFLFKDIEKELVKALSNVKNIAKPLNSSKIEEDDETESWDDILSAIGGL